MHLPGHNFTGPGTKLNKRLNADLTPKAWSKLVNRVDICYVKNKDTKTRNEVCDKEMLEELDGIYNSTLPERIDRGIVRPIIRTKKRFRMGLKKGERSKNDRISSSSPLAAELHKPVIKNFPKRRVYVNAIDKIWAADLVDMQAFSRFNHGVKYLLTVIDVFSKYGWMFPLKDKTRVSVAKALKEIFKQRKPEKLWTDKGNNFIINTSTLWVLNFNENEGKSSVAERWNRTMKEKMFKYFTANNTNKYIDVLDDFVDKYNNAWHSSINMTPVEASKIINTITVYRNLYQDLTIRPIHAKFKIGDKVRILKKKKFFEKGFTPNWTEEVFTVSKIQRTDPITHKITDLNDEEIQGTFYEQELQKTTQEVFRIEKVVKKDKTKSLVKWKGYPASSNSWVDNKDLIKL